MAAGDQNCISHVQGIYPTCYVITLPHNQENVNQNNMRHYTGLTGLHHRIKEHFLKSVLVWKSLLLGVSTEPVFEKTT